MKNKTDLFKISFTLPVVIYSLLFILLPILYVLFLSFLTSDSYGGYIHQFTFNNYLTIFDMTYLSIFLKSVFSLI